jgi:predicted glycosyltransferase involved in capsule biosynthesis
MTFRTDDAGYRRRNLETVLAWLSTLKIRDELDVVVVEQSQTPTLSAESLDELFSGVRIVHAYNNAAFNKSWGLNVAARYAQTPLLFFADTDLIVPNDFEETLELLARGVEVVKPYNRLIDLNEAQTDALDDGVLPHAAMNGTDKSVPTDRAHIGEHVSLAGGVFAIQARRFMQLGGFDERFIGWGGEDDAMTLKIQRVRPSTMLLDGCALHLFHPRDQVALMNHEYYAQNKALLEPYRQLPEAQLLRMMEIQKQMSGNPHKYSPNDAKMLAV